MVAIDKQDVVRMNRDMLYTSGIFDLKESPLMIILPDAGKRFMSMQVISEDHYTVEVVISFLRESNQISPNRVQRSNLVPLLLI